MNAWKKPHYAWIVCLGCIMVLFCTSGLAFSAFSIFQPYLISNAGLTNTQSSNIIMNRNFFSILGAFLLPYFYKRIGYRIGLFLSVLAMALSFVVYGLTVAYTGYFLASAICGIAHGLGGMVPVSVVISRWFHAKKSFAIGLCAAGSGLATVVIPPIVTVLVETYSLKSAFLFTAILVVLLAFLSLVLIRDAPEKIRGATPFAAEENGKVAKHANNYYGGHDISRGAMAALLLAFVLIGGPGNAGFAHYAVLYRTAGFDSAHVSLLISVLGAALMVGKCIYGFMVDKIGGYRAGYIFFGLLIFGNLLCCLADHTGVGTALVAMGTIGLGRRFNPSPPSFFFDSLL